jgi:hypothetical protein
MKKNSFIIVALLALCSFTFLNAQNKDKETVGLYSLDYLREVKKVYPITVAGHIGEKLSCFSNISLLDQSNFPALGEVLEDTKKPESALAETVEQGRRKGAKKLVTGFITAVEEEYVYETQTFRVSIMMNVSVVDVETGESKSKHFSFQGLNKIALYLKLAGIKNPKNLSTEEVLTILGEDGIIKAVNKSFDAFDRELFPFLASHFGEYDEKCSSNSKMPTTNLFKGSSRDEKFEIVNKTSENSLLVRITDKNPLWIKNITSFDLMTDEEVKDLRGNVEGTRPVLLESGKFKGYSGEYAEIELSKKGELSVDEIVDLILDGENVYFMPRQKKKSKN